MVTLPGKSFSVAELVKAGVKRISFASSLYRAAMAGFLEAATEIKQHGTFTYLDRALTFAELSKFLPE
jgi:2-methylisocitrate lyase-like PEP mutase family enzyme